MPLGAPHYHKYKSSEADFVVEVFCTPRYKTYHLFYDESERIKGCSRVFAADTCVNFEIGTFFESKKFLKTIRMNDRKFHKLFEEDTLIINITESKRSISFLPVE